MYSASFINAKIAPEKVELAKDFLRFCNSQQSLVEFTKITSTPKALSYGLSETEMNGLSYYAKNVLQLRETADIVYPLTKNSLVNSALMSFTSEYSWYTKVNGTSYNVVSTSIRDYNISAKDYFEGLSAYYTQSSWAESYSKYFN